MEYTNEESHAMSKLTTHQSVEAPSSDDTALMTRLGLLLGDHRASTVKTQAHIHPILSHHNSTSGFSSTERRRKAHYTTSPASTLSDKGIGSSVGSFDSEFRSNLSALAETSVCSNRTGSLDSRTADVPSHSRTDSGIPSHSRSSSDIVLTEKVTDVTKSRLAEQCEEKLWNADPRRNSGNTQTLPGPEVRSRIPSVGKARKAGERSTHSSRERVNSASDAMKLPQLCQHSPNNSKDPSIHSSVSSSRSLTPAASLGDVGNYKFMKRSLSSHSNGTVVFDSEPLPPPPPPPPIKSFYGGYQDLPPPPPPPPVSDDLRSNHSRASSSDRTLSNDDFQHRYREENNNFLHPGRVMGKPPLNRVPMHAYPNVPQMQLPNPISRASPHFYEQAAPNMIQMLRASSGLTRSTPSPKEDMRMIAHARQWNSDHEIARNQLPATLSAMDISHSRQSSANSSYAGSGIGLWEESRPHSLSAPPINPLVQSLMHKTSASFDNSGFHRRAASRSSTRSNERRMPLSNASSTSDMRGRMPPYRLPDVNLHCLQFDLPWAITSEAKFVGREWLFGEIMNSLNAANSKLNKGVVIYGKEGTGKTAIIHQLESTSYNGTRKFHQVGSNATLNKSEYVESGHHRSASARSGSPRLGRHPINHSNNTSRTASPAFGLSSGKPGSRSGSQTSLSGEEAQKRLSSQVVAHHYCQADNNTTCYVPEFLHSIAAQLAQAPQLTAYREFLLEQPRLQNLLSLRNCVQNPSQALKEAILEPLIALRQNHKLPRINLLILIDGLGEAELHRPDHGHSILTFLQRHLPEFPDFLKAVVTCRTQDKAVLGKLPLFEFSIDYEETDANITRDIQSYIAYRIAASKSLSNLTLMGKPDTATTQKLLTNHLSSKCEGNMLYLRLVLDLLENGKLVPKSSGFKIVPVNMSEAFLLMCNLKFTSASSFVRVRDIVAVALASLYPLKDEQIYKAITSGLLLNDLPPEEFHYLMESVSQFLVVRPSDNRRSFIHPCFREWLTHGNFDDNQHSTYSATKKFAVDPKRGHALLATVLSRQPPSRLTEHAALELAHHLLKARMFRGQSKTTGMNSNELHAAWMAQCSYHLSDSLATVRNLFYPNIKVTKLLLHSGANPNIRAQVLCEAPVICAAAHIGSIEFVDLLLTYRADINMPATNGMTALAYAAAAGHKNVVELLLRCKPSPRLDLVDRNGHSPLLHAVSRNHLDIAVLLLTCDLYVSPEQRKFSALQGLIAAATTGSLQLLQYLLDHPDPALHCETDGVDPTRGESALTAAASRGKEVICEYLVGQRRANIEQRNKSGMTPLLCAVKQGQWETVHLLLNMRAAVEGADFAGRTPLITAASVGHTGVMELLLSHGANVHSVDKEGLTALGWASLKGHLQCARSLLDRGSDIRHPDKHGRTPIDLAAYSGNENIVELLLNAGAEFKHEEFSNMSPLDRAIVSNNPGAVARFIERGANMTDSTWKLAMDNPGMLAVLLEKCVDDANFRYREGKIREARDIYSTALYHLKEPIAKQQTSAENELPQGPLREFTAGLLLGLARCARKLDDLETAEISSTRALELKPHWYEALYVRARVRRESSRLTAALRDVEEAEANAPPHNAKEISRLLERIREETNKCGNRNSISESSESPVRIPGQRHNSFSDAIRRPRVNSASSSNNNSNNNGSRSSSPLPPAASEYSLSRSYQPQGYLNGYTPSQPTRYHERLSHLSHDLGDMRRNHSQDNICESRMGGANGHQQPVPYQHRVKPAAEAYPLSQPMAYNCPQVPGPAPQHTQYNTASRSAAPGHVPRRRTVATEL